MTNIKQSKRSATETILAQNAEAIRALGKRVIGDIIEIGRRLTEAKKIVGHGNWLPWIEREFGWEETTARRFVHSLSLKSGNLQDLSLPVSGLYMLAAPSTPDEAREAVIERAQNGERLSVKSVRNQIDQVRKKQTAEPAQAEGAFPIYGPCAGGRVVTERTSTKPKTKAAEAPALAPQQQIDPDHLIGEFTTEVRSRGLYIARQIEVAYRARLIERLREVIDEIEIEADRWAKAREDVPGIPEFLRRAP